MVQINIKIAISFVIVIIFLRWIWKFLDWVWIHPKKLEKRLKLEGLKGSSYKFLLGDMKEINSMVEEAKSKPINFTNDYISRVFPHFNKLMMQYGMSTSSQFIRYSLIKFIFFRFNFLKILLYLYLFFLI